MNNSYPIKEKRAAQTSDCTPNIDFRSDTVTKPTTTMRECMSQAIVGDDVYGEDPSVNQLQLKVANLLEKEAALFVPSGTMSNLLALLSHCQRGEEAIVGDQFHIYCHEAGGASALGGVVMQSISSTKTGHISASQVANAIRPDDSHFAQSKLICIENTVSGFVQDQSTLESIAELAKTKGLVTHLDGARIMHAAIKTGLTPAQLTHSFDSVSLCLSKGLGSPAGSVLCGSQAFIKKANRLRKMLGGGMRQSGILAAAGIYALDNNVQRLQQDHDLAIYFAQQLDLIEQVSINVAQVETNMLFASFAPAAGKNKQQSLTAYLRQFSISIAEGATCRIVLHLEISREAVDLTLEKIKAYYQQ